MGVAALAATAVSGVMGAVGKYQEGQSTASAANYQAQVAENNAQIARQNAEWTSQAGEAELTRQGMKNRATGGAIRAGQAASGVDVNTGSNVDVQSAAAELGQLDALTIRSDTARKIYGYQVQEASEKAQAGLYREKASSAKNAGTWGAITSLLGTAGSVGGKYSTWQSKAGGSMSVGEPLSLDYRDY